MTRGETAGGSLPLSTAQLGLWLSHQRDPTGRAGTIAEYIEIDGPVDPDRWRLALQIVLDDAEACRVRFVEDGGEPRQWLAPATPPSYVDLNGAPAGEWLRAALDEPADLTRSVMSSALLRLTDNQFLSFHRYAHSAVDYFAVVLVARRFARTYSALASGQPPPPNTFGRLAQVLAEEEEYNRSPARASDREYWLRLLDRLPVPPDLHGRPSAPGHMIRHTTFLPAGLLTALRGVAREADTSWSRVVMAATAAYLSRLTGERDIVLGLPVMARTTPLAKNTPALLANVLPLRLSVRPSTTLVDLAAQTARAVAEALAHQRYRYEDLRQEVAPNLFGWTVNVMAYDDELRFAGRSSRRHNLANGPVEDLGVFAFSRADGRGVQVDFTANPARYRDDDVAAHQRAYLRLLSTLAGGVPVSGAALSRLPPSRSRPVPVATLPAMFEARVRKAPDATALIATRAVSYVELNARANRVAHYLIRAGVGPGDVVALGCARTVDSIVGLLGIAKAGAAFLPIDVDYPAERIALLLKDAAPVLSLMALPTLDGFPDHDPTDPERVRPLCPASPAYVIYTSGSTGTPNGVVVGHSGLAPLAEAQIERFAIGEDSRVLRYASPGFDGAVAEIVTALTAGAALVLAPPDRLVPGAPLAALIAEAGVTHLTMPPTVLAAVPEDGLPGLETLVVAGEPCPPEMVRRWAGRVRMINAYGPTEATVCATMSEPLSPDAADPPPIGRPIPGTRAYVLDSALRPVPTGIVGELHLAGAGLAQGYLGRPGATAERFPADPYGPSGSRRYRTGDLARYRPDGALEFVGRVDGQIALRGFRIEPAEVEAVLTGHPAVTRAAVAVAGDRLVAYVVPARAVAPLELRHHASRHLPAHMVPSGYVVLDELPLTPHGKLDRSRLSGGEQSLGRPADSPIEEMLCRLFAEVLGRDKVGPDDDFFALGGHSLLALKLVHRLREVLPDASIATLFQAPTVADLLARLHLSEVDHVLRIRDGGDRPPLFCLPPGSGQSWCYLGLRDHLPAGFPIYGLQLSAPQADLPGHYLDRIRAIQPAGPYRLLGWSVGGHLAHAVAAALRRAGEEVALLAVLDAFPHDPRLSADPDGAWDRLLRTVDASLVGLAEWHTGLIERHRWPWYDGDLLVFGAAGAPPAAAWRPYVGGRIEAHSVPCGHYEMTEPGPLAAIGAVLADSLARMGPGGREGGGAPSH